MYANTTTADNVSLAKPSKQTHFKIGVSFLNHYPLFDFSSPNDQGVSWAIMEAFAKEHSYTFEYVLLPPVRLQSSLNEGDIDFIFPDNPNWTAYRSNKDTNIYSKALLKTASSSYVASYNKHISPAEVSSVSIPYGYTALTWMGHIEDYGIETIPARDLEMALSTVSMGKASAADVEYNVGQYLIKQNPSLKNLVVNPNLPHIEASYHLSTIKHVSILEEISQFSEERREIINMLKDTYKIKEYEDIFSP